MNNERDVLAKLGCHKALRINKKEYSFDQLIKWKYSFILGLGKFVKVIWKY